MCASRASRSPYLALSKPLSTVVLVSPSRRRFCLLAVWLSSPQTSIDAIEPHSGGCTLCITRTSTMHIIAFLATVAWHLAALFRRHRDDDRIGIFSQRTHNLLFMRAPECKRVRPTAMRIKELNATAKLRSARVDAEQRK